MALIKLFSKPFPVQDDYKRQPSSAPSQQDLFGKDGNKPLPRFNNLVRGELARDADYSHTSQKPAPNKHSQGIIIIHDLSRIDNINDTMQL